MNTINEFWLRWMTDAGVQLSVLIILVGVIAWFGRNLSARLRYALWTLVLLKALLPPFWSVPFSVVNLSTPYLAQQTTKEPEMQRSETPGVPVPKRAGGEGVLAVTPGWSELASDVEYPEIAVETIANVQEQTEHNPSLTLRALNIPSILFAIWLGGATVFWSVVLYHYVWAVRLLGKGRTVETGPLVETLESLRKRLGVRKKPRIVLSNAVGSPFLWGLWKPSIALPADFPGEVSSTELESVLLHELTHWKRGDLFVTHLELFVQGIFWFHPLVWMAVWNLRRERESACDEAVLASGCIEAKRYGDSLLNVLEFVRDRSPLPVGFLGPYVITVGILERKTQLQHRLEEIMIQRNRVRRIGLFGWATLLFFAACVLPMAVAKEEPKKPDEKPAITEPEASARGNSDEKQVETKTTEPEASAREYMSLLKDIRITGNYQIAPKEIADIIKSKKGEPYSAKSIQADVKALKETGWFSDVKTEGVIEIRGDAKNREAGDCTVEFIVTERPILHYVKIVGNKKLSKDEILEATKLKPGAALDPEEVKKAKERIEQFYKEKGVELVSVNILTGDHEEDRGSVFHIKERPDDGFATGGGPGVSGFTHLITYGPKGDFSPRNPMDYLNIVNPKLWETKIQMGYFRTKIIDGKLIAMNLTADPAEYKRIVESIPQFEYLKTERLTKEMFEAYEKTKQESLPPLPPADGGFVTGGGPGVSGFTHLVYFQAKGDFNPRNPGELLAPIYKTVYSGNPVTGYFRTKPVGGKLVGSLCTGDPDKLEKLVKSMPQLEFVKSERLTKESFEAYEKTPQLSLPNLEFEKRMEKTDWYSKLNAGQKKWLEMEETTFAYVYDPKNYDIGYDREAFERKWVRLLEGPEPGFPGRTTLSTYDEAIIGLATIKSDKAAKLLVKIATERVVKDNAHRHFATKALGILGDPSVVPDLIPLLYHYNMDCRCDAQISLVRLTGQNFGRDADAWGKWFNENRAKLGKHLPEFDPTRVDWSCGSDNAEIKKWCDPEEQKKIDAKW